MPRVYKWSSISNSIAAGFKTFVDDLRAIGATNEIIYAAVHRLETILSYLGMQDATRKRRPNTRTPGEWTGCITHAIPDVGLFVTVLEKKWIKAKVMVDELLSSFSSAHHRPKLERKGLEKKAGFLMHLAMTF